MSNALHDRSILSTDAELCLAVGAGALLVVVGASWPSLPGACLALSSAPLLYRGVTGRWPGVVDQLNSKDTMTALAGACGVRVREATRLEVPVANVFRFWRRLEPGGELRAESFGQESIHGRAPKRRHA